MLLLQRPLRYQVYINLLCALRSTSHQYTGASSSAGERSVNTNAGATRVMGGGGVDRQVIMMIANASLDVIEDVMKVNGAM